MSADDHPDKARCPFCTRVLNLVPDLSGSVEPGEFVICLCCHGVLVVTAGLDLRRPSDSELLGIDWQRYRDTLAPLEHIAEGVNNGSLYRVQ